ncbi:MAG TPA: zinc ribbon domain-containing protein [Chthonomonas sp.]|uniref:double zinc ribbon domain-containing protein n=1 Tax=Chthonomonas sp. TaxID=2282153 RepID=UPI002B4B0A86|nr:zinc ribbon domain-containing protein [Chthonomonas sp.]HLI48012.1 zinc ribbon domain-containing protein [Chthonomonas sp.]
MFSQGRGVRRQRAEEASACEHCGALVYGDTRRCPQCGRFPIKLHLCPRCKTISAADAERCWRCGYVFLPEHDYL